MKKTAFTILGAFLLSGVAAAQTEALKPMAQPTTLNIPQGVVGNLKLPSGDTGSNNRVIRYIKDKLNITVTHPWEVTGDQMASKTDLAIASGRLPDAMSVNSRQLQQLVDAGLLEDLTGVYNRYASTTLKNIAKQTDGEALARSTFGGKLYALPGVIKDGDGTPMLWVRADWLKKLGLKVPQTLSDVEKVAQAFVTKDPDGNGKADTVGIAASKDWKNRLAPLFNASLSFPGDWIKDSSGKVIYGTTQPQTQKALATVADWYKRGLIDPEFPTLSEDKLVEKVSSGRAGMVFGPWWSSDWPLKFALNNVKGADWVPVLAPLANDKKFHAFFANNTTSFMVVRKGYATPEAVIKLANLQAEYENNPGKDTPALTYEGMNDVVAPWSSFWPAPSNTRVDWLPYHANRVQAALKSGSAANLNSHETKVFNSIKSSQSPNITPDVWGFATAWGKAVPLLGSNTIVKHRESYKALDAIADSKTWPLLQKFEDQQILNMISGQLQINQASFDNFRTSWLRQGGQQLLDTINK